MKVGDKIRIINMDGEPGYTNRTGIIERICRDPWGDTVYYGTWGGLAVYPDQDTIELVKE